MDASASASASVGGSDPAAALTDLLRSCLPVELDEPSLSYLSSLIADEAAFLRSSPGCLTRPQLIHLLLEQCEDSFVTFEIAADQNAARKICQQIVLKMEQQQLIQLAQPEEEADPNSSSISDEYAAGSLCSGSYQ